MSRYEEVHSLQPEEWREFAACRPYPTEWWYPADGMNGNDTRKARIICSNCTVREDCLVAALRRNEDGLWGGMNIRERRAVRQQYNVQKRLVCKHCRIEFDKDASRQVVQLYCSDRCRKDEHIGRLVDYRRINGRAS